MSHSDASSASLKRKLLDRDPSSLALEGIILPPKKAKLSSFSNGAPLNVKQNEPAKNISDEFPDEFVYCHQCNKKRNLNGEYYDHCFTLSVTSTHIQTSLLAVLH